MEKNKVIWFIVGLVSLLYLANLGAGVIELIPDNIPLLGNLDEGSAGALLLTSIKMIFD